MKIQQHTNIGLHTKYIKYIKHNEIPILNNGIPR